MVVVQLMVVDEPLAVSTLPAPRKRRYGGPDVRDSWAHSCVWSAPTVNADGKEEYQLVEVLPAATTSNTICPSLVGTVTLWIVPLLAEAEAKAPNAEVNPLETSTPLKVLTPADMVVALGKVTTTLAVPELGLASAHISTCGRD